MIGSPRVESALALNGRIFAMLSPEEVTLFEYMREQGRKHGVVASIVSQADPAELAKATSKANQDEVMRRANSTVSVVRS